MTPSTSSCASVESISDGGPTWARLIIADRAPGPGNLRRGALPPPSALDYDPQPMTGPRARRSRWLLAVAALLAAAGPAGAQTVLEPGSFPGHKAVRISDTVGVT
jgi:hypothetical protein